MPSAQDIRCSFAFTPWERVRLAAVLTFQRKLFLAFALAWPAVGLILAILALAGGVPVGAPLWRMIGLCIVFIPVLLALSAAAGFLVRRGPREPFNYVFDHAGVHVSTSAFAHTHPWSAIVRVKRSQGFVLLFFAPRQAHAIPLRALASPQDEQALVALAQAAGVGAPRA
ncbi:YcxB family protein [Lysobacter enzymogenes]|uniref:YcxB family protein n=1 Tax=Lysobacter enzymogenes TaxID=69 RepID=UPI001AF6DE90|nr:YcxB family protein [Lysobacter enzymogenes]QQQ02132.1 YcxB family protein [Lysobacter enzymogenes]